MLYYMHSCEADAALLTICLPRIKELDADAHVILAVDPAHPIPKSLLPPHDWVEVISPPYPLGGNLNGEAMVTGMLATLIRAMEHYEERYVVKLDSDCWLNSVDWLRPGHLTPTGTPEPDYIGLERADPLTAAGDCYRLSLYAARAALKGMLSRVWPKNAKLPEDRTILELVLRSRLPVLTVPYSEGRHRGMHAALPGDVERRAWVVHCGESCVGGGRAPRDFVQLRMRTLQAACAGQF